MWICIENTDCNYYGEVYKFNPNDHFSMGLAKMFLTQYMPTAGVFENESIIKVTGPENASATDVDKLIVY